MADKLKLYALSTCIHCRNTRNLLDENNVDYDIVYVDKTAGDERDTIIEEVRQHNPALSYPTMVFGDKVVIGFRPDQIKEMLGL